MAFEPLPFDTVQRILCLRERGRTLERVTERFRREKEREREENAANTHFECRLKKQGWRGRITVERFPG